MYRALFTIHRRVRFQTKGLTTTEASPPQNWAILFQFIHVNMSANHRERESRIFRLIFVAPLEWSFHCAFRLLTITVIPTWFLCAPPLSAAEIKYNCLTSYLFESVCDFVGISHSDWIKRKRLWATGESGVYLIRWTDIRRKRGNMRRWVLHDFVTGICRRYIWHRHIYVVFFSLFLTCMYVESRITII